MPIALPDSPDGEQYEDFVAARLAGGPLNRLRGAPSLRFVQGWGTEGFSWKPQPPHPSKAPKDGAPGIGGKYDNTG